MLAVSIRSRFVSDFCRFRVGFRFYRLTVKLKRKPTRNRQKSAKNLLRIETANEFVFFVEFLYEFEYFSFLSIAVLFSAGNAKKKEVTVFIVPIATIGGFARWVSR